MLTMGCILSIPHASSVREALLPHFTHLETEASLTSEPLTSWLDFRTVPVILYHLQPQLVYERWCIVAGITILFLLLL